MVGDTVAYRSGVTVTDNSGEDIELQVDASKVDTSVPGEYEVVFSATDSSGNRAELSVILTVSSIDPAIVDELVEATLARIIDADMSLHDKAQAIFIYVQGSVRYDAGGEKTSLYEGAYEGLKQKAGDCWVYAATSEMLLTQAGIDNLPIKRVGGSTRHYWNLVNLGEGWYHFDACPNRDGSNDKRFMFTETEAVALAQISAYRLPDYYTYDHSLYPAVIE
jgi:transglutaminase-like putative cysteine protease